MDKKKKVMSDLMSAMKNLVDLTPLKYENNDKREEAMHIAMEVLVRTKKSKHELLVAVTALILASSRDDEEFPCEMAGRIINVFVKGGVIPDGAFLIKDRKVTFAPLLDGEDMDMFNTPMRPN